jgi:Rrf2 family iron-sulfur cluster assembly transcriptional regulator
MLLSSTCMYGLRAVLHLADKNSSEFVSVKSMAEELEISFAFLTKILQQLTAVNILVSYRGPKGGVRFVKPPETITIFEIIQAIDGATLFTECVLGLPNCGEAHPCPMHHSWAPIRTELVRLFSEMTLKDLTKNPDLITRLK